LAAGTSASRSSTVPRKFGYCRKIAETSSPRAASSAAASVAPCSSPISSIVVPHPTLVLASVSRLCGCTPRLTRKRVRAGWCSFAR
jgi:hypothetical protein